MALILSLETSATACSVALHEDGKTVKTLEVHEGQAHAAKLAVLIDEIFKETQTEIAGLKAVAVSAGPGSYTGLRIGTSTAKGICFALSIPLIAINTLESLAFQVLQQHTLNKGLLCPMIDARRMEVYCQVMDLQLSVVRPVQAEIVDETSFNELLKDNEVFFFGDGAEKCKTVINDKNAFFIEGIAPAASAVGGLAFSKFEQKQFEDLMTFTPFYLKEFVAKKAQSIF
jgi:tRNA threonylcarbamoyladenosine biosynthesis protein TsaB